MEKEFLTQGAKEKSTTRFDMETLVGFILQIGVLLSVLFVIAGLIWTSILGNQLSGLKSLVGTDLFAFLTKELVRAFSGLIRPSLLISFGIIILLLTPYVRVFASMLYFMFAARNLKYSLFTFFVLGVLTYSLFLR